MKKRLQTNSSLPRIETGAVNLYCCRKGLFDVGLVHMQSKIPTEEIMSSGS